MVGRIASCASCAFFCFFLKYLGDSGTYSSPKSSPAVVRKLSIACGATYVPSVRMYVIKPSPVPAPSYSRCAADIVLDAPKPSCLFASCCIVDVVNGGPLVRLASLCFTSTTRSVSHSRTRLAYASASSFEAMVNFPSLAPSTCVKAASNVEPSFELKLAFTVQYGSLTKASTSSSLSHTNRSATLCTRPADRLTLDGNLRHSSPESVNPNR